MSPSNLIRVLIVDDHDMVRRGLAAFLRTKPDLLLAGEARVRTGGAGTACAEGIQPDVVLMDLLMPEMDGATTTRSIRPALARTSRSWRSPAFRIMRWCRRRCRPV